MRSKLSMGLYIMDSNISTMLTQLGFTNNEAVVYSYILNHPDLTASEISKRCMLDKSSTYRACDELVKRNLLLTSPVKKGIIFRALSPTVLYEIVNKQESELKKKREIINEIINNINIEKSVKTHISVEYGEDALEKWMNESLKCESKESFQLLHKFSNLYRSDRHKDFNKEFVKKRNENEIKLYLLEDIAPNMSKIIESRKQNTFKEIRIIPENFDFKHSLIIFDNTSVVQTFGENGEIIVTTIKDKYTTEMFLSIFKYIWNCSDKI